MSRKLLRPRPLFRPLTLRVCTVKGVCLSSLSFTGQRQVRYPAPDVARGFMLALIALANVPFWVRFFPDHPEAGRAALAAMTDVDQWWFLLRSMFVDRRAYPLFSILFGFGMAIMAKRTIERERRDALGALPAELSAGWNPAQWQFFGEAVERRARCAASRLIRRRGWWMLAIGGVHSLVFQGDIIGTYGLVAVVFAEVIVMTRVWPRVVVAVSFAALSLLSMASIGYGAGGRPMSLEYHSPMSVGATYPAMSFGVWLFATPFAAFTALVIPCVMIGVALQRWGALQDPHRHGCALGIFACGGLAVGALGAVPYALGELDWAHVGGAGWTFPLFHACGVAGACGWLALLALLGGGPRVDCGLSMMSGSSPAEELGVVRSFLSAIGRRSMTAYLAQTLLFVAVFACLGLAGVRSVGVVVSALIALAVWAVIGVGCVVSDGMGHTRGPAERLLRWLVARSAAVLPLPPVPMAPWGPVVPGVAPWGPVVPGVVPGGLVPRVVPGVVPGGLVPPSGRVPPNGVGGARGVRGYYGPPENDRRSK